MRNQGIYSRFIMIRTMKYTSISINRTRLITTNRYRSENEGMREARSASTAMQQEGKSTIISTAEMAKEYNHNVSSAGTAFFPLIVETFSQQRDSSNYFYLNHIAADATLCSEVNNGQVTSVPQSIQQLLVKL